MWKAGRLPSYISPRAFSLALLDTLAPQEGETSFHAVRREVERIEPEAVRDRLLLLLDEAEGDLNAFRHNVEAWFDDTMARVSGWYKRQAQVILLVIALGLTAGLNVNTIAIADRMWSDSSVRAAVVSAAQSPAVTGELTGTTAHEKLQKAADGIDGVAELGIPLGYRGSPWDEIDLTTVVGWLITIVGLSLGAPFWFDALSRLSRLRGTGKPEIPLPASERGAPNERIRGGL